MKHRNKKRRVCVVVNSRANYGRIKSVLYAVRDREDLELLIIVGASALLHRFGEVHKIIEKDGFVPSASVYSIVEGETPTTMAKSTGLAIIELATLFENLKPDFALTIADRFETMATAVAASYMNIPLAHTQGGEITGSIDESVRHAVTKLAHVHFPATELAAERLVKMGEDPATKTKVVLKSGRFGPYVTDGEYNATLRKDDDPETITIERAAELLAEKRAKGPAPKKRGAKKTAAKRTTKKTPAKKTTKKAAAKKS